LGFGAGRAPTEEDKVVVVVAAALGPALGLLVVVVSAIEVVVVASTEVVVSNRLVLVVSVVDISSHPFTPRIAAEHNKSPMTTPSLFTAHLPYAVPVSLSAPTLHDDGALPAKLHSPRGAGMSYSRECQRPPATSPTVAAERGENHDAL